MKEQFCQEYAQLVKKYGIAWGYDSGASTPQELHTLPMQDEMVTEWLARMAEGQPAVLQIFLLEGENE